MLGLIDEEYRLPLVQMSAASRATLKAAMKASGSL
jgi:dihydrodipicolinate synthase/N-acetylneuraminate lyase